MISAIDSVLAQGQGSSAASTTAGGTDTGGGFDAALKAAQKAKANQQAHQSEMDEIREKGFYSWVRDMRIEKLKEELRKKVMASMGLDEESLSKMEPMIQKILEQKIQDEVEKQLAQVLAEEEQQQQSANAPSQSVAQQTNAQAGKNDRQGISCPVIPALAGAEGVVVF